MSPLRPRALGVGFHCCRRVQGSRPVCFLPVPAPLSHETQVLSPDTREVSPGVLRTPRGGGPTWPRRLCPFLTLTHPEYVLGSGSPSPAPSPYYPSCLSLGLSADPSRATQGAAGCLAQVGGPSWGRAFLPILPSRHPDIHLSIGIWNPWVFIGKWEPLS